MILDEYVRSTNYSYELKTQEEGYCDHVKPSHTSKSQKWRGKSWYRFQTPAGSNLFTVIYLYPLSSLNKNSTMYTLNSLKSLKVWSGKSPLLKIFFFKVK